MTYNAYNAFHDSFTETIKHAIQVPDSFLRPVISQGDIRGEYLYTDYLNSLSAHEVVGRNSDTQNVEAEFDTRRVGLKTYAVAPLIDPQDVVFLMRDPAGRVKEACLMAINRAIDSLIYTAFDATVTTGREGASTEAYDTSNTVTAGSGLTVAKLREIKTVLDGNNMIHKGDTRYILCTTNQIDNLLGEEKATSADYATVKALAQGEINSFMGFEFIMGPTSLVTASGGVRKCFFWTKQSMFYGVGSDVKVRVTERPDKNHSTQIHVTFMANALRQYEEGVGIVNCTES